MVKNTNSNKKDLVSVLIGTYNRADLISRCLDSVFNQTHENIEVIVIDDASTDNTLSILEKYKNKYSSKFNFIVNKVNKGIAFNSNLAFSNSSGDFIALIGDDDQWIDNRKLEIQLNKFYSNSKLGIVSTYWNDIKNGAVIKNHMPSVNVKNPFSQILKGNGVYCGSTVMISRTAWNLVDGFDERMKRGTDSELFRSIIKKKFLTCVLPINTTNVFVDDHVRMTPTNSLKSEKKSLIANLIILKKYFFDFLFNPLALFIRVKQILKIFIRVTLF